MKVDFWLWSILAKLCQGMVIGEQIPLSSDSIMFSDSSQTFMDEMFGDIVNTEYSKSHRQKLLLEGVSAGGEVKQQYMPMLSLKLPGDDDTSDIIENFSLFGGIVTYSHLPSFNCFDPQLYDREIDVAIVGAPFDTGTSYRPGARFGPDAIRSASKRLGPSKSKHNYSIVDCGDVSMSPFDNRVALNQLYRGHRAIHQHKRSSVPKIITMGGDHTITLMALRSAYEQHGKQLRVIHFDSHIDTWNPLVLGGGISEYMSLNHGTFLHYAHELGYIQKSGNWHVGMRAPYIDDEYDEKHDAECGFKVISARDIDTLGARGISKLLKKLVGSDPVYITVDIDVLDPAFAPGTGTMEAGGFSTRELLTILDGLQGIRLIGADVVEVSPPFDTNAGITSLAATDVISSFLKLIN